MSLAIVGIPYIDYGPDPLRLRVPLFLSSTTGMMIGDTIEIMLDNGEFFRTTIAKIPAAGQILISQPLPRPASAGNIVVDLTKSKNVLPDNEDFLT